MHTGDNNLTVFSCFFQLSYLLPAGRLISSFLPGGGSTGKFSHPYAVGCSDFKLTIVSSM